MAQNEIKNVLVLGTTTFRISQFCKLFEAYLSYNSYEEALRWNPNLNKDDGIDRSLIFVNDLHLICTPNLGESHISKQILSILSNFEEKQSLSAIIILINSSIHDSIHLQKLRSYLFHVLKQFSDNILYVYAVNDDFYKSEQIMKKQFDGFEMQKRNVFNFNATTFYNATAVNWCQSVEFCKVINNYIIGHTNYCGLQTIYVDSKISDELLSNLINNLTELLIFIYICINVKEMVNVSGYYRQRQISVGAFKRNITVCHDNGCTQIIQILIVNTAPVQYLQMKIPKICHSSCNCFEANINVSKCMVFESQNKTCKQCKCKAELHSQNYFKTSCGTTEINQQQVNQEKDIIINILATIYFFKKQNQEVLCSDNILRKFLNIEDANSKIIFDLFKNEFNGKVKEIEAKSQPITKKDVIISLTSLYKIKEGASIIPKFMEEIFPRNIQLKTVTNASNVPNKKATLTRAAEVDDKKEIQMLKNKVVELEGLINKILDSIKDNTTEANGNDLNLKLNQETASCSNVNFNQNEKDKEEKEMNWNIETKSE